MPLGIKELLPNARDSRGEYLGFDGSQPYSSDQLVAGNELFQIELLCVVTLESLTCFYMLKIYISAQRM